MRPKVKKMILFAIPMSICNLRCHYCYLAQRPEHYQGIQPTMKYSPEEVGKALSIERCGGPCYLNFCADGETLLLKDLDKYVYELVKQGHFAEIITNCLITPVLERFLAWPADLLARIEFKCSFHYLELKKHGKLQLFADNVNKIFRSGASANIEITPSDELVPYIDEVKNFSIRNWGALPHITIARDDNSVGIDYLTNLPMDEYDHIWGSFDSDFWKFKKSIFGKKQKKFCYAGAWSYYVDLSTGEYKRCYCGPILGDLFAKEYIDQPLPESPIGRCNLPHCYNGHIFLTLGLIPRHNKVRYGDLRNRVRPDGTQWLQPQLMEFFNSKLEESNSELPLMYRMKYNAFVNAAEARLKIRSWLAAGLKKVIGKK